MECCDGKPLRDVIKETELTIKEAVNLAIHICEGLKKAHNSGLFTVVGYGLLQTQEQIDQNEEREALSDY